MRVACFELQAAAFSAKSVVHYSGINSSGFKTLYEGDRVTFEIEQGDKGPAAINVTVE